MRRNSRFARVTEPARPARSEAAERDVELVREGLDQLPIGIVLCADDGREVFRNQRVSSLVGDLHVDVLVARATSEVLAETMSNGPREELLELKGPPARSIKVVGAPLPSGGAIAYVEDASERRQLDAVRSDFVANVNHELRTPIGALGVLADALADERDPQVIERLAGRIAAEADRARQLIEDLLDFSRVERDEPSVRDVVRIADIVEAARQRVLARSEQVGVEVRSSEVDASLTLAGDGEQLLSAVTNLLDNALKYTEPGGPDVHISARGDDRCIDIVVRDEGIGIPAKDLDRIFERFYRVDRARARATGGTGLGLAIVRHVATNHGGDVLVSSVEGVGTTMTLRLARSS